MNDSDKLPLVKQAMLMLSSNLKSTDRVSIVVYAGSSGVVLQGCKGNDTSTINEVLGRLSAGGSTAGGEGIQLAYALLKITLLKVATTVLSSAPTVTLMWVFQAKPDLKTSLKKNATVASIFRCSVLVLATLRTTRWKPWLIKATATMPISIPFWKRRRCWFMT